MCSVSHDRAGPTARTSPDTSSDRTDPDHHAGDRITRRHEGKLRLGLIRAAIGAIGGTLADRWKDFLTVPVTEHSRR